MNRDDALHIVSDEDLFSKLIEINSGRFAESESYASCSEFLNETGMSQLTGTYLYTHRYRLDSFLFFKNSYDYFMLLEPSVLRKLHFFLGACIISCRLLRTVSTSELRIYQTAMGQDLFSFSYFYAVFAAYADELRLTDKLRSFDVSSDNVDELIGKCGDLAFYRMTQKFSSERLRILFMKKITLSDFHDLCNFFGLPAVRSSDGAVRLFRLAGIYLHNIGINLSGSEQE